MGGWEVDIGRRGGEPGKAVQAGKRGKRLIIHYFRVDLLYESKT